jgi:SAM-dependent methyltransferase
MISASRTDCLVCGASAWEPLPDPGAQAVASDGCVIFEPLGKRACTVCGLVVASASRALEESALYAHTPGLGPERARQSQYAGWIAAAVDGPPQSILDVGCGNGSLLLALRGFWPGAALLGCDPAPGSVNHGRASGLKLWRGTATTLPESAADLVIAVNVIEHTTDPVAFLGDLARAAKPGGSVIVVCPDGGRPDVELLMGDHLFSFTTAHLKQLADRAGLDVRAAGSAPEPLGAFQMIVGCPSASPAHERQLPHASVVSTLNARRSAFLDRWAALDERLLSRAPSHVVCFGTGEAATLLRAYAPQLWARVTACTADTLIGTSFYGVPVIALDTVARDTPILVGVRSADQRRVADRLRGRFDSVITWYDFVEE